MLIGFPRALAPWAFRRAASVVSRDWPSRFRRLSRRVILVVRSCSAAKSWGW